VGRSGNRQAAGSVLLLIALGVSVSSDGNSQLEGLWDAAASAVLNVYDAYGWVVPALLLSLLLLGVLVLLAWALEDLPVDAEALQGFGGIFRWTRKRWREGRGSCTLGL